ncbi:MAG: hypothetical protein RLZZ76_459 [Candidatus Parcubacteria bacterium]|jgi:UPF0755 protein
MEETTPTSDSVTRSISPKSLLRYLLIGTIVIVAIIFTLLVYLLQSTKTQLPVQLTIEKGDSVQRIAAKAKDADLVRSETVLYILLTQYYDPTQIFAGTYVFSEEVTSLEVARKLSQGEIESQTVVLTIPEGTTRKEIAKIAARTLENFSETEFLEVSKGTEGLLFPETYYVPPAFTPEQLWKLLTQTHTEKMNTLDFSQSSLTKDEVLVLASIVEREANDAESMRMVSGILQNRIAIGMALQADASMEYVLDKPLKELTPEDLKIDTPYNTYLNTGLPPTPIGNPGLASIEAVLKPQESDFLFYITGNDGNFYYARTYSEHLQNINRYLK